MLSDSDRKIYETFARRVRERFPNARVLAFGSRARGDAQEDSDFDTCVILDELTSEMEDEIRHISWEVAFDNETVFNTLLFSRREFEEGPLSESTIVANILREGIPA
ncbi:MAG: nucleotidyltransferase domain-containing protein [bacterium]